MIRIILLYSLIGCHLAHSATLSYVAETSGTPFSAAVFPSPSGKTFAWSGHEIPLWADPNTGLLTGTVWQSYIPNSPPNSPRVDVGRINFMVGSDQHGVFIQISGLIDDRLYHGLQPQFAGNLTDGDGTAGSGYILSFWATADGHTRANSTARTSQPTDGTPGYQLMLKLQNDDLPGGEPTTQPSSSGSDSAYLPTTQPITAPALTSNPDDSIWTISIPEIRLNEGSGPPSIQLGSMDGDLMILGMDPGWYRNSPIKVLIDTMMLSFTGWASFNSIIKELRR